MLIATHNPHVAARCHVTILATAELTICCRSMAQRTDFAFRLNAALVDRLCGLSSGQVPFRLLASQATHGFMRPCATEHAEQRAIGVNSGRRAGVCVSRQWLSNRWSRVALGLLVGAVVGFAVYGAGRLTGPGLFVLAGAAGGGSAAIVMQFYSRSVRLTDITITVPQFSELHFAVTRDSQQAAWKLFVESVTRISTQPLTENSGLLREALTSLYGLFAVTRELLLQTQPSTRAGRDPTVEHLAIAMLNNELRPFLSRWHPALREWETAHPDEPETLWQQAAECRAELASMQQHLEEYVLGFGRLAGLPNSQEILQGILGVRFGSPAPSPSQQQPQPPRTDTSGHGPSYVG